MSNIIQEINDNDQIRIVDHIDGIITNFNGDNNSVTFYKGTIFSGCKIVISGNNSKIIIGKSKLGIHNLKIYSRNSKVRIGDDFSCWGVDMRLHEPHSEIFIGNDCMFSEEIRIYATDVHAIYDNTTKATLNFCRPIKIGNHVWVGRGTGILKGTEIQDNSIIGFGSVVCGKFKEKNICIAGNPAKILRYNVNWSRMNPYDYNRSIGRSVSKEDVVPTT